MLLKIISIAFNSARGGFDDTEIRDFIKDVEVISISDHVFVRNEIPYLTVIVKYFPLRSEINPKMAPVGKRDESWRKDLSESDQGLFNLLRDWRLKESKKAGIPPYAVFTNSEFTAIIKQRPQSKTELGKIDGVGKSKIEKYADAVLSIVKINLGPQAQETSSDKSVPTKQVTLPLGE